jgi:methylthioribulose-1-phosphate dehydratase
MQCVLWGEGSGCFPCSAYLSFVSMPTKARSSRASQSSARTLSSALAEAGRAFYSRGWVLGTSGNFSAVLQRDPLRLLITASGLDKGALNTHQFLEMDAACKVLRGSGKHSAEALLHVAVARLRGAGSILHTHSVWSTLLSDLHAAQGGLAISGYEMLKGLEGIKTHEYREWLPIVENSQDMPALAASVESVLRRHPDCHGFLLRAHGLYTWGEDVAQARRHVEILEFLLEVLGRRETREAHQGR